MTDRGKIVTKVVEGFKALANCQYNDKADFAKISSTAEDLLFAVYKAGVSNVVYTDIEKRTIGPLVPSAIQGLGYQLSELQTSFSSQSIDSVRIQRSGFQFLIDELKNFPAKTEDKSKSLDETLREFMEREDVEGLDERLKTAEFDPYSDDSERSTRLQAEIAKLPSTHWWFFN